MGSAAPDLFETPDAQAYLTDVERREREIELQLKEIGLAKAQIDMELQEEALRTERSIASRVEFQEMNRIVRIGLTTVFLSAALIGATVQLAQGEPPWVQTLQEIVQTSR